MSLIESLLNREAAARKSKLAELRGILSSPKNTPQETETVAQADARQTLQAMESNHADVAIIISTLAHNLEATRRERDAFLARLIEIERGDGLSGD